MTLRMFRKSLLIEPAASALRRAETVAELEDCWFDFADGFADDSDERRELLSVYRECLDRVRKRELDARMMPRILGAG